MRRRSIVPARIRHSSTVWAAQRKLDRAAWGFVRRFIPTWISRRVIALAFGKFTTTPEASVGALNGRGRHAPDEVTALDLMQAVG